MAAWRALEEKILANGHVDTPELNLVCARNSAIIAQVVPHQRVKQ